jgi:hypothetical protein
MALRLTTLRPPEVGIDYRAKPSRLHAFVLIGRRSRAVPSSLDPAGAASTSVTPGDGVVAQRGCVRATHIHGPRRCRRCSANRTGLRALAGYENAG